MSKDACVQCNKVIHALEGLKLYISLTLWLPHTRHASEDIQPYLFNTTRFMAETPLYVNENRWP